MNHISWLTVLYIFFGMLLFVPGVLALQHEKKKSLDKQQDSVILLSYVLICLGVIISIGLGGKLLFG